MFVELELCYDKKSLKDYIIREGIDHEYNQKIEGESQIHTPPSSSTEKIRRIAKYEKIINDFENSLPDERKKLLKNINNQDVNSCNDETFWKKYNYIIDFIQNNNLKEVIERNYDESIKDFIEKTVNHRKSYAISMFFNEINIEYHKSLSDKMIKDLNL